MILYATADDSPLNFAPATKAERIIQNLRIILKTRRGSLPNYRDFGLSWDYIDRPIHEAKALLAADVIETVERYEKEVRIVSVTFGESDAIDGKLKPIVGFEIIE